ncbi:hypothetical protein A3742_07690 [Oleiphilus sp. HI0071]|uniref:DUF5610 domain-containing protein n=1 Tax=unclassified Oleiphilus TaxID=2631174 RepID=UPI0007C3399A|nr:MULTISPECIES: DUF5610 domain-containing protein [unclassified Oleiphilus]KZY72624.1 hypothetical protein A3737_11000 [Oleiphilus sp. HI0065]KZY83155.1 hypothetical protein A3742_07690 [Oleiphilus sp. HI0071]KZZ04891.1 hypothetical protein A3744_09475 [Oleiphilus sp. HI0073]KZZ43805.1 hypothetical protein A3758_04275 [Oleiphilus sp. HI0118]KZZ56644.1 hypothetical protein A3760_08355 [Oleiphilus sp. HI0122]KZZ71465.1 hypothetical protein A3765_13975 [Oleiphilus sp. HI0130]KZZ80881.1 hypothe
MISFLNNLFPGIGSDQVKTRVSDNDGQARPSDTATLFSQGLKRGLGVDVPPSSANDPGDKIFDVQAVVDTVSGFIEQAISKRRDEGATQTELDDLISQAREGVTQGFQLARDDIDRVGLLSDDLSDNIDAAEQGINTRIDKLEDTLKPADEGVLTSLSSTAFTEGRLFERSRASFQFELKTQEGDRIQISAQELFQRKAQFSTIETDNASATSFESSTRYSSAFSISVKGDLNNDEVAALDALLVQVADISDSFFAGGIEDAFNQALSLEFDSSQIAQFSLDLKSSSLSVVEQTEVRTSKLSNRIPEEYRPPQLPPGLQTLLADYAQQVEELLESAKAFSNKVGLQDSGESLVQNLQREFDQSVGRSYGPSVGQGNGRNDFFDALLAKLST